MAINQKDFVTPITGNVVIQNNGARIILQANTDFNANLELDESFKVILRKGANNGPVVATSSVILLRDTSNVVTYSISSVPNEFMAEASNIIFTLTHTNLPVNTSLTWYTEGNVTSTTFVQGNSNVLTTLLHASNLTLTTVADAIPSNEERYFSLVFKDNLNNVLIRSSNITILDSGLLSLQATGGSISTSAGIRTHVFTSSDTFTITRKPLIAPVNISYLLVGGGGAGGASPPSSGTPTSGAGAGGGAGGVVLGNLEVTSALTTPSPIPYTIEVGAGGAGSPIPVSSSGTPSTAFNITAFGGGRGGSASGPASSTAGQPGGSGGGSAASTFPVGEGVGGQGYPGGSGGDAPLPAKRAGGGGGAGGAGTSLPTPSPPSVTPGPGGPGIFAFGGWYGGGGGSGGQGAGTGGIGGGGSGGFRAVGNDGGGNTGGGGGGGGSAPSNPPFQRAGGAGGSGIVILSYPVG